MRQRNIIEINGIIYMSPSAAADKWQDISRQKIVAECKAGKVVGACLDSSNKWIIPIDSLKPIDDELIRKILISLICIKNNNDIGIEEIEKRKLDIVVDYLMNIGVLEEHDIGIEYEIKDLVLTEKGIHIATEGKKNNINWVNAGLTFIQIIGSIASVWSLLAR